VSQPTFSPASILADTIVPHGRTRSHDHRCRDRERDDGGLVRPGRSGLAALPGVRESWRLPRQRRAAPDRSAGGRAPAAVATAGPALPLHHCRLRAGDLLPGHLTAGPRGCDDHAALRPLRAGAPDPRPGHGGRGGPRAGPILGHGQHDCRGGHHRTTRHRRPGPPRRGAGDRGRRAPLGAHPPRRGRGLRDGDRRPHSRPG